MDTEQTKQKIAELESLRSQTRAWRVGTALVIIAVVVGCVWTVIHSLKTLFKEGPQQEIFVQELGAGFNDRVRPPAEQIAKQAVSELSPVVQEEFRKLNARAPELMEAFQKETTALAHNLPERAEKVLDGSFTALMKQREAKLKKMFPNLSDENLGNLVDNLIREGSVHMASVIDDMFKPHEEVFDATLAHLYQIQEEEAANIKDETPTWEMALLFFDAIRDDFEEMQSPEYAEALREGAKQVVEKAGEAVEGIAK